MVKLRIQIFINLGRVYRICEQSNETNTRESREASLREQWLDWDLNGKQDFSGSSVHAQHLSLFYVFRDSTFLHQECHSFPQQSETSGSGSESRLQSRKILSSPPPMGTPKLQLLTEQPSLRMTWRLERKDVPQLKIKRKGHSKMGKRGGDMS